MTKKLEKKLMSEDRKKFTLAVFAKRDEAVKEIYQEYNRENNHLI